MRLRRTPTPPCPWMWLRTSRRPHTRPCLPFRSLVDADPPTAARRQRRLGGEQLHVDRVMRQALDASQHQRTDRGQHRLQIHIGTVLDEYRRRGRPPPSLPMEQTGPLRETNVTSVSPFPPSAEAPNDSGDELDRWPAPADGRNPDRRYTLPSSSAHAHDPCRSARYPRSTSG